MTKISTVTIPQKIFNKYKEKRAIDFYKVEVGHVDDYADKALSKIYIVTDGTVYLCSGFNLMDIYEKLNLELPRGLGDPLYIGRKMFHVRETLDETVKTADITLDGREAYNAMFKVLRQKYSKENIYKIMKSFDTQECKPHQELFMIGCNDHIYEFENSFYYDINSAYCTALSEIYPRCKKELERLYAERKINPQNKQLFNFFVGMAKRKGYNGFYYEIVKRTKEKLLNAIEYTGGQLLYANTDGFIVSAPTKLLDESKTLGGWKCEEKNKPCYVIRVSRDANTSPYTLFQIGDYTTGKGHRQVAKESNLAEGKVVKYKLIREYDIEVIKNIRTEEID